MICELLSYDTALNTGDLAHMPHYPIPNLSSTPFNTASFCVSVCPSSELLEPIGA
jgi:hypothetical protein